MPSYKCRPLQFFELHFQWGCLMKIWLKKKSKKKLKKSLGALWWEALGLLDFVLRPFSVPHPSYKKAHQMDEHLTHIHTHCMGVGAR